MLVQQWRGDRYSSVNFKSAVKMSKKDTFQIRIKPKQTCFCYVIKEDSKGAVSIIFNAKIEANSEQYLPQREEEFHVSDPAGTDKYSVIVSAMPQNSLEKALEALAKDAEAKADMTMAVQDEILRIRQSLSTLPAAPERPIAMGGVTRGDSKLEATQFRGRAVYVKTIIITH